MARRLGQTNAATSTRATRLLSHNLLVGTALAVIFVMQFTQFRGNQLLSLLSEINVQSQNANLGKEYIVSSHGLRNVTLRDNSSIAASTNAYSVGIISESDHATNQSIGSEDPEDEPSYEPTYSPISDQTNSPAASFKDGKAFDWEGRTSGFVNPNRCHVAENICRTTNDKYWFYFGEDSQDLASRHRIPHPKQPLMTFNKRSTSRIRFTMGGSLFHKNSTWIKQQQCILSPIENHVVLSGDHMHMMGEYVQRIIMPLHHLMQNYISYSESLNLTETGVQFYLYFHQNEDQQILPSHHLYMNGLPFGDNLRSWIDEVESTNSNRCQCYSRLVFCGFEGVYQTVQVEDNGVIRNLTALDLLPSNTIPFDARIHCAHYLTSVESLTNDNCTVWQDLRNSIIETYERKNPDVNKDIAAYRMKLINNALSSGPISANYSLHNDDVFDWKIVALSQRRDHRIWLNINETLSHCNEKYNSIRIVCVEVDVESLPTSFVSINSRMPLTAPDEQFVLYRSINALIGIHGSQLTQGILMPSHSVVLELFQWLPSKEWGIEVWGDGWTNQKNHPTPMGIMWHNTDINEAGFYLTRESVPLCLNVSDHLMHNFSLDKDPNEGEYNEKKNGRATELEYCLQITNGDKFRWDFRNFNVGLDMIEKFVDTFLHSRVNASRSGHVLGIPFCNWWRDQGEESGFVLFNLVCRGENGLLSAHHYYH